MTTPSNGKTEGLNIFFFLAKLEQDALKGSNQTKATILAKLNYQEQEYKTQIANWKAKSNTIGADAKKAQEDADKSGEFLNSFFGQILSLCCIGLLIYDGVKHKGFFKGGSKTAGDQGKLAQDVQNANEAQTKVQQTQQKMTMTENIQLNSQQQNQQSMQNMYNSFVQSFGSMGSYNNQRG